VSGLEKKADSTGGEGHHREHFDFLASDLVGIAKAAGEAQGPH
jgi:hypothetical protein